MRKALALGAAAALAIMTGLAAPAAAVDGTTTVSFTVVDGTLAIVTTPAAVGVSTTVSGTSKVAEISLGVTTVNDTRVSSGGWAYSAASGVFTGATSGATIPGTAAAFWIPSAPTSTLGSPTFPTRVTTPTATGTLLEADATGPNDATFTPSMRVTVPVDTPLEVFTGTVTQSVV